MEKTLAITVLAIAAVLFTLLPQWVQYAIADDNPPISQPLVREGTLAVKLVDALRLGTTSNEAEAESTLASVGIAPRNGWIADYPATPDVIGELQQAIGEATDSRRIDMGKDEALQAFQDVMVAYNLSIKPSETSEGATNYESEDPAVVNNYYSDEGPPVITYYAPPPDYYYLYTWVPYPFWWWDFWFPGFFILADFDVDIHGHGHHGHGEHGEFVTNHFRDARTGQIVRIDPAHRVGGGTFANRGGAGWSSPSARGSAQAILNTSRNAGTVGGSRTFVPSGSGTVSGKSLQKSTFTSPSGTHGAISAAPSERTFNSPSVTYGTSGPSWGGNKTFSATTGSGRTFSSPSVSRTFGYSGGGRSFTPSYAGKSFSSPSVGRTFSSGKTSTGMGSFGGFSRR